MAEGILGLGSGQASTLNQDLIDKLKEAERKSTVAPIENSIEEITKEGGETETISAIKDKANELLEAIKPFDLFVSGGVNAFDQKSATTSGTSVVFDAVDETNLNMGSTSVTINSLAKRDVYETMKFSDKEAVVSNSADDDLIITHDGTDYSFETNGKTYQQLANDINLKSNLTATIEEIGTNDFRIVIKSAELGTANSLTIQQNGSLDLGLDGSYKAANTYTSTDNPDGMIEIDGESFSISGSETYIDLASKIDASGTFTASYTDDKLVIKRVDGEKVNITQDDFNFGLQRDGGRTLAAQDMTAIVDGIDYVASSNSIVVDGGLKITAVEEGTSSINIEKDTTTLEPALQNFVTKYNELVSLVDAELYSSESSVKDKSSLRDMLEGIKSNIFNLYGKDDDLSIFNVGFDVDKNGILSLDGAKFKDALAENPEDVKMLFIGVAEDRGLGTQLKEQVDALDGFEGLLTLYEEGITSRKDTLNKEKEKAEESLNSKYSLLSLQFSSYSTIITQMENSFSGLKLMIQQSVAK